MAITHSTDISDQLVIILAFLSLFFIKFNLLKDIIISLLLLSIGIGAYLLNVLLKDISLNLLHSLRENLITLTIVVELMFILLTLVFSVFFYYFNYEAGYLYSLLLLLAIGAVVHSIFKVNMVSTINQKQVVIPVLVISCYTTMMLYASVYTVTILMIPLYNPVSFVQGLLLLLPGKFVSFVIQSLTTNSVEDFMLQVVLPSGILFVVLIFGMFNIGRVIRKNDEPNYDFIPRAQSISKFPFIMVIVFFAVSQAASGLNAFLTSSLWLLVIIQLLFFVFSWSKEKNEDLFQLQLTILLWTLLIAFIQVLYYALLRSSLLQAFSTLNFANETLMQTVLFFILNSIGFLVLYIILTRLTIQEQEKMIIRANVLGLVLLISFIQPLLVQLFFTSVLVLIAISSTIRKPILRNSINLNKAQIKKNLIPILTEVSIFYIAFLVI